MHAGSFLLQQHRHTRVPVAPATGERLRHLGEREARHPHRDPQLARELGRQSHVLVRQPQGERRDVERVAQELGGQGIEGAPASDSAHAQSAPQIERVDAAPHAQGEDLGDGDVDHVPDAVMRQLGDRSRAYGANVELLIGEGAEQAAVAVERVAITAHVDR